MGPIQVAAYAVRRRTRSPAKSVAADESLIPQVPSWVRAQLAERSEVRQVACPGAAATFRQVIAGDDQARLVSTELQHIESLDAAAFERAVDQMIQLAFGALAATSTPWPVRVWNFLPGIYRDPQNTGIDRYRAFNLIRHRAFCSLWGSAAVAAGALPTATCVGYGGSTLGIHILGADQPGTPIENPRQVPAFAYSARYGARPPCFARATLATLHRRRILLVGGTASVLGEDSIHLGSREAQLQETMANLHAVVDHARSIAGLPPRDALEGILATRIYYKHRGDLEWFQDHLPPALDAATPVEFIRADICRDELLVEIEVIVDLDSR